MKLNRSTAVAWLLSLVLVSAFWWGMIAMVKALWRLWQ